MNKRLREFVPPVSIQTSLSCICICIWILFISYKYKRHSRVIWWGPLPLAMCRLLRLVSSTNHDHRSSHTCKRLLKQTWCRLLLFLSSGDYVNRLFCSTNHDHRFSHPSPPVTVPLLILPTDASIFSSLVTAASLQRLFKLKVPDINWDQRGISWFFSS